MTKLEGVKIDWKGSSKPIELKSDDENNTRVLVRDQTSICSRLRPIVKSSVTAEAELGPKFTAIYNLVERINIPEDTMPLAALPMVRDKRYHP